MKIVLVLIDKEENIAAKAEVNKKENEKFKETVDELIREVNRKAEQICELLVKANDTQEKLKEMGGDMYQCDLKLKENEGNVPAGKYHFPKRDV